MDTKAGIDPFFTRESLGYTGAMYLAGHDPHHELLSPATLADLTPDCRRCCCKSGPTMSCSTTPLA